MNKVIIGVVVLFLLVGIGLIVSSNKGDAPANQPVVTASPAATESLTSAPQVQNMITLTTDGFSPKSLTVKAGDKVTWVNKSGADATVNSSPHPMHTDYPLLNLGAFSDGGMLSLSFNEPGTYKYHDHLNPSRFGSITVE